MSDALTGNEKQLVVFDLGKESYGIDIGTVREIIPIQSITVVPGTPYCVEGVINLRGSVIPVVDLRKRFRLTEIQRNKDTRIVVVSSQGQDIGVIVDSVAEVLRIPIDSIGAASSIIVGEHSSHLLGIVKMANRLVILLDMDQVLARLEIVAADTERPVVEAKPTRDETYKRADAVKQPGLVR